MSIPHEEAAKKVHPSAAEFRHVKRTLAPGLYGWVFQVKRSNTSIPGWSWVTCALEVSEDITSMPVATRNLRAYVRHQPSGGRRVVTSDHRATSVRTDPVTCTEDSMTFKKKEES